MSQQVFTDVETAASKLAADLVSDAHGMVTIEPGDSTQYVVLAVDLTSCVLFALPTWRSCYVFNRGHGCVPSYVEEKLGVGGGSSIVVADLINRTLDATTLDAVS